MWYFAKNLSQYPTGMLLTIPGCYSSEWVRHNNRRWEKGGQAGLIVKQSDVTGRGMTVVAPASCKSTTAYVEY